jgi:hypothetical protein
VHGQVEPLGEPQLHKIKRHSELLRVCADTYTYNIYIYIYIWIC